MTSFIAADPYAYLGEVLDNGHCLRHCQIVAGVSHSSTLRRGAKVRGSDIPPGTCIGTFNAADRYSNATDGSSHVALFIEETADGLRVVDAWVGQPVHERVIPFRNGVGKAVNDGDRFHVVEA